jgi:hypothetical protein
MREADTDTLKELDMARFFNALVTALMFVPFSSWAVAHPPGHVEGRQNEFRYTTQIDGSDRIRIVGMFLETKDPFDLVVRPNGWVKGQVGASPVEFSIGRKRRDAVVAHLRNQQLEDRPALTGSAPVGSD